MKKYKGEYTITFKINDLSMPEDHTNEELESKVKEIGRESVMAYLSKSLFDPQKKVIFENIKSEEKN